MKSTWLRYASGMPHQGPPEFAQPARPGDLTPHLKTLLGGKPLDESAAQAAFEAIASGHSTEAEMGAFLALLATRMPTVDEIVGAAKVMRANVARVPCSTDPRDVVDTAGTGGAPKTFNVSTLAAVVAAASGAKVAKHGNRSRTGRGSAEVLEKLGVDVNASLEHQARCIDEANICFCFAIHHHPAARHVLPVRRALGVPTLFNLLGPLTNPAGAGRQVMGVYAGHFVRPIAEALVRLGSMHALVLHSDDGLDEISIGAPTRVAEVRDGRVSEWSIDPRKLGLERSLKETVETVPAIYKKLQDDVAPTIYKKLQEDVAPAIERSLKQDVVPAVDRTVKAATPVMAKAAVEMSDVIVRTVKEATPIVGQSIVELAGKAQPVLASAAQSAATATQLAAKQAVDPIVAQASI